MNRLKIQLTKLIAPIFYKLYHIIKNKQFTYHWLKGGRGSTKSSFLSIMIIIGMMNDPEANAVVVRKVANTLRESVYDQMLWAIDMLGVSHLWKEGLSPLQLTYIETGQRIVFKGADNPAKVKASTFRHGYAKYIWYEEVDEFKNYEDIGVINKTLIRGTDDIQVFYSYNPPKSPNNWVNTTVEEQKLRDNTVVHHSTWEGVPVEWLGKAFVDEANYTKESHPNRYAHEYLGEVIGTGVEVFSNLIIQQLLDEEIATFDKTERGLDFGFAADPLHYTENYYDKARKRLFIYQEITQSQLKNADAVKMIKKLNPLNQYITADSAEPRTIAEFKDLGLRIRGAKKGPGSVDHGIKWLQDLESIIIDPVRCPNTAREFKAYELEIDKHGNPKGSYPDYDNHSIDATRYSRERDMKKGGIKV